MTASGTTLYPSRRERTVPFLRRHRLHRRVRQRDLPRHQRPGDGPACRDRPGRQRRLGIVETVPSMRALMVCYDPLATSRADLQPAIDALIARGLPTDRASRQVTIPCCYDDPEFAPDLAEVAERTGKIAGRGGRRPSRLALQGLRAGLHAGPRLHRRPRPVSRPAAPLPAARARAALVGRHRHGHDDHLSVREPRRLAPDRPHAALDVRPAPRAAGVPGPRRFALLRTHRPQGLRPHRPRGRGRPLRLGAAGEAHERRISRSCGRACSTRCRISAASASWRSACRPRAPWTGSACIWPTRCAATRRTRPASRSASWVPTCWSRPTASASPWSAPWRPASSRRRTRRPSPWSPTARTC